ncbi:hypothetical protein D9M70_636940 [compost metagenome]
MAFPVWEILLLPARKNYPKKSATTFTSDLFFLINVLNVMAPMAAIVRLACGLILPTALMLRSKKPREVLHWCRANRMRLNCTNASAVQIPAM